MGFDDEMMRIFVTTLFNFYPLVSMFCNRKLNNRIDKILKRMLSLVQYHTFPVSEPFRLNKSIKIHQRNTQVFATWFPKVKKNLALELALKLECRYFKKEIWKPLIVVHWNISVKIIIGIWKSSLKHLGLKKVRNIKCKDMQIFKWI